MNEKGRVLEKKSPSKCTEAHIKMHPQNLFQHRFMYEKKTCRRFDLHKKKRPTLHIKSKIPQQSTSTQTYAQPWLFGVQWMAHQQAFHV